MSNELVQYRSFEDVRNIAQTFALTGYFDAKGSSPIEVAKAVTKILAGQEMGFGPFASINGIHIIQGRPSVSGGLIATAIKRSGRYDYRIRQMDETACKVEFFEMIDGKRESLGVSTFTAEDARKAGTQNMQKFPRNMLFNRAISNGYKWYCPDVFEGGSVYTPEELGAQVNEEGEYIESTAKVVEPARMTPVQRMVAESIAEGPSQMGDGGHEQIFREEPAPSTAALAAIREWVQQNFVQPKLEYANISNKLFGAVIPTNKLTLDQVDAWNQYIAEQTPLEPEMA